MRVPGNASLHIHVFVFQHSSCFGPPATPETATLYSCKLQGPLLDTARPQLFHGHRDGGFSGEAGEYLLLVTGASSNSGGGHRREHILCRWDCIQFAHSRRGKSGRNMKNEPYSLNPLSLRVPVNVVFAHSCFCYQHSSCFGPPATPETAT